MKNVIFISPNFPMNYWQFCYELRCDGINVLGIGDQPYDELTYELKSNLTEYYKVYSLEDYDEVYRAVAFFIFKYGRIDFLESNNEYWLEQDAHLRTDFNIPSGFHVEDVPRIKYKSCMKEYYRRAGIPTARYHMVGDEAGCRADGRDGAAVREVPLGEVHQGCAFRQIGRAGKSAGEDEHRVRAGGRVEEFGQRHVGKDRHAVCTGDFQGAFVDGNCGGCDSAPAQDIQGSEGLDVLKPVGEEDVCAFHNDQNKLRYQDSNLN